MINFKARLKNKTFLISGSVLVVALIYRVLAIFDVLPQISENQVLELISMGVNILALVGVVVDPTTEGLSDSQRAMTYFTQNDVRMVEREDDFVE